MPQGYVESRREQQHLIADPVIRDYFDKALRVTAGQVFSTARFRDILNLNWRLRDFKNTVRARQRLHTTVRVDNLLLRTHVGALDGGPRVVRADGRAGYLLMGPSTPMGPSSYWTTWHGQAAVPEQPDLGYVEVCHTHCRVLLARTRLLPRLGDLLGEATVRLRQEVRDIEFRLWVNESSGLSVASVAISQEDDGG